jgi:hypothetical protein
MRCNKILRNIDATGYYKSKGININFENDAEAQNELVLITRTLN